jgi:hypothetical protein
MKKTTIYYPKFERSIFLKPERDNLLSLLKKGEYGACSLLRLTSI